MVRVLPHCPSYANWCGDIVKRGRVRAEFLTIKAQTYIPEIFPGSPKRRLSPPFQRRILRMVQGMRCLFGTPNRVPSESSWLSNSGAVGRKANGKYITIQESARITGGLTFGPVFAEIHTCICTIICTNHQ